MFQIIYSSEDKDRLECFKEGVVKSLQNLSGEIPEDVTVTNISSDDDLNCDKEFSVILANKFIDNKSVLLIDIDKLTSSIIEDK